MIHLPKGPKSLLVDSGPFFLSDMRLSLCYTTSIYYPTDPISFLFTPILPENP